VVSYVDSGSEGHLVITSGKYGSGSKVEIQAGVDNSATVTLGLAQGTVHEGLDVAGTINGEEAEGAGQILSGKSDSDTIAGLKLKIDFTDADVAAGTASGSVEVVKGFASKFDELLESITRKEEGMLARKSSALQSQINYTNNRIEDEEERLDLRMEALYLQFWEMEKLLGEMGSTQSYLETQLAQLGNNWKFSGSSKK
jgi:flagellar hook-associated protein 2